MRERVKSPLFPLKTPPPSTKSIGKAISRHHRRLRRIHHRPSFFKQAIKRFHQWMTRPNTFLKSYQSFDTQPNLNGINHVEMHPPNPDHSLLIYSFHQVLYCNTAVRLTLHWLRLLSAKIVSADHYFILDSVASLVVENTSGPYKESCTCIRFWIWCCAYSFDAWSSSYRTMVPQSMAKTDRQ